MGESAGTRSCGVLRECPGAQGGPQTARWTGPGHRKPTWAGRRIALPEIAAMDSLADRKTRTISGACPFMPCRIVSSGLAASRSWCGCLSLIDFRMAVDGSAEAVISHLSWPPGSAILVSRPSFHGHGHGWDTGLPARRRLNRDPVMEEDGSAGPILPMVGPGVVPGMPHLRRHRFPNLPH